MRTAHKQPIDALRDSVESYVRAMPIPACDERAIAARRGVPAIARAPRRPWLGTAALAAAAALAIVLIVDASAVVAEMQRVLAGFALVGQRTMPMNVRDVDLATARADVPFEIILPPAFLRTRMTLREALSPASPASDTIVFNLQMRPGREFSIAETRDGGGTRHVYLAQREPEAAGSDVAPLSALPNVWGGASGHISIRGNLGTGAFVPLTWVTRGTRVVLLSPPGMLSDAQLRAIRSAMSN